MAMPRTPRLPLNCANNCWVADAGWNAGMTE
jgi:hypothetical protein